MLLQWLQQLTGSKRTLVVALQQCAPGSYYSLLNSVQNKRDRLWDSSRDLFSNSLSEFLENFSFCLHTSVVVKTFLMHCYQALHCYTTESMVVTYVSHLILFQICLSIKFLNFLGGFFKKMFNCVTVEQITQ